MYLLDTNVISELNRPTPSKAVQAWIRSQPTKHLFVSVITLAEIIQGIHAHPDRIQRERLQHWLDHVVRPWLGDCFLTVDEKTAEIAGEFIGRAKRGGITLSLADSIISATALHRHFTVVTRNTSDFQSLEVSILNPWEQAGIEHESLI